MLLIHPPVAKPCEPPAGIAALAGALKSRGVPTTLLDGNLEGVMHLLASPQTGKDNWSRQAIKGLGDNLEALRSSRLYANLDRYKRAVSDLSKVLALAGKNHDVTITFSNYGNALLSPLKSANLLQAAKHPERNPFFPWFSRRLPPLVEETNPPLVGLSLNYLSQAFPTFAMIGFLKKRYPELPLILGGGLISSWMRQPEWRNPFQGLINYLCAGPGEKLVLDLLGVQSKVIHHATPDYAQLVQNPYLAPGFILPYAASRGCWWQRCSFCPEQAEGEPYLPLSPEQFQKDLDGLQADTTPTLLHLLDNALHPRILDELTKRPQPIPWYGFARIAEPLADEDYCRALRRSGCVMLKLGIESGDQGVLDRLEKGISLKVASEALNSLQKAGIATYVYLLFGTPEEALPEARQTLQFTRDHAGSITFLNLAIFNLPAINAASSSLTTKPFDDGDLSLYRDFDHPRNWNRKTVRLFLEREFKKDGAILPILLRDPPHFTSNHAPLLQQGCQFCRTR